MPAIQVSELSRQFTTHVKQPGFVGALKGLIARRYITKTAVDNLSFAIEPGEIVGFLGPNGAGKTTTLKILSGVLHPTSGTAQVLGHVPWKREPALQKRFSLVLGQKNQLWWDLPAIDSFILNRDIYDIEEALFQRKVDELAELLAIRDLLQVPVRKLSLGERMKCEIAASLLHSPEVLFLDEPTIGLDVVSQANIRKFLQEYNEHTGITVLLTSHYMTDIEALCKRVIVIDEGRAIFDGDLRELLARAGDRRQVRLRLREIPTEHQLAALHALSDHVVNNGYEVSLSLPREQVASGIPRLLETVPVDDLTIEEVDIENVIRELFTRHDPVKNKVTIEPLSNDKSVKT